jgi:hypothetical protein
MQTDDQAARKHFEHSLVNRDQLLLDYPKNAMEPHLQIDKCFSLAALTRHEEAARLTKEAAQWTFFDPFIQYRLACVYSQCIPAVAEARQPKALTPEDMKLQAEYADKALKCLDNAFRRNYPDFFLARTDVDLDPIRADPRFQEILAKSNKKSNKMK